MVQARRAITAGLLLVFTGLVAMANDVITAGGDLGIDVSPLDGRIVMDLRGAIWTLPAAGGLATLLVDDEATLRRPRWSPDGSSVLFEAVSANGSRIRIRQLASGEVRQISDDNIHDQDGAWHPGGNRIVYASDRRGSGLDLWETDLPTGLSWRLTSDEGDETQPAWSANGRHLAWISKRGRHYALMLRRHGEGDVALIESVVPISSPAWRPDGSLITFLRHAAAGTTLEMAILAEPLLVRVIASDEKFVTAPVSWRDRMQMLYAADGMIRSRGFENRRSRPLHFRAVTRQATSPPPRAIVRRELEIVDPPGGRLIIRCTRLFDGIWQGYRPGMDIVIESGRVVAIEPRRDRDDGIVLDLGNVTVIPGLIDAMAPPPDSQASGAAILAYGITTIVTPQLQFSFDPAVWESEMTPGPRLLQLDATDIAVEIESFADSALPGLDDLLHSRQAAALGHGKMPPRRFASLPDPSRISPDIIVGSRPNRLSAGVALHAELLALQAAGLTPERALRAVGSNAARGLGLENQVGTITPGALADLVLVNGDPLADVAEALKIVAVVRNGRFFSLVSLLELARQAPGVE